MRCAPFIHSFIVDEWETTNPEGATGPSPLVTGEEESNCR